MSHTSPVDAASPIEPVDPAGPTGSVRSDGLDGSVRPDGLDGQPQTWWARLVLLLVVALPLAALAAAVPVAWRWGLGWRDVVIGALSYLVCGLGITVGFHRLFTHGSFKAGRGLRIALAIAGSMAIEGPLIQWVADHRRHHQYSDREGDPHSPWRYGTSLPAVLKGLCYAHVGWLFERVPTSPRRYAPDLLADRDMRWVSRLFPVWATASVLGPAVVGGLVSLSWSGALSGLFWAGLVRIALLHHVTWSVNSICHVFGKQQFVSRDRSTNVWWLALPSLGESWHNLHHAEPTSARHGVLRAQLDISARVIWLLERAGWVSEARWPTPERIAAKRIV